jgi:hypothetical protein
MPPRVHRRVCVEATVVEGVPERSLHTAPGHRGGGGRLRDPAAPRRREDQDGMARRTPRLAQPCQRPWWHGDRPILPALPVTDVDQQARAIAIAHVERGAFLPA